MFYKKTCEYIKIQEKQLQILDKRRRATHNKVYMN